MPSSEDYKRQIMNDLSKGNVESFNDVPSDPTMEYQDFDDFAQRSSPEQRRQLFGQSLHPDRIPPGELEPELQRAIAQIKPNERDDVAQAFLQRLNERGLSDRQIVQQLSLSSDKPNRMTIDDVSRLASFSYHNYPDIFQNVLAEKPGIIKFLGNPLVAAILGIMAAKWLSGRRS